jgi:hypothetical protein
LLVAWTISRYEPVLFSPACPSPCGLLCDVVSLCITFACGRTCVASRYKALQTGKDEKAALGVKYFFQKLHF